MIDSFHYNDNTVNKHIEYHESNDDPPTIPFQDIALNVVCECIINCSNNKEAHFIEQIKVVVKLCIEWFSINNENLQTQ
jgi:hypothetical protein